MKLTTILGSLLLMGLEVFASPIDVVGAPQELTPAHQIEVRGPTFCCVGGTGSAGDEAAYVSTLYPTAIFNGKNGCSWGISIVTDSCDGWAFHANGCTGDDTKLSPGVQPVSFCQKNGV
ncbi:hypothetical protein E4U54_002064 [Claviceps lovelessii]|nr:hypothetical protein E4U54_002064 [Claviceps lovelessii]